MKARRRRKTENGKWKTEDWAKKGVQMKMGKRGEKNETKTGRRRPIQTIQTIQPMKEVNEEPKKKREKNQGRLYSSTVSPVHLFSSDFLFRKTGFSRPRWRLLIALHDQQQYGRGAVGPMDARPGRRRRDAKTAKEERRATWKMRADAAHFAMGCRAPSTG